MALMGYEEFSLDDDGDVVFGVMWGDYPFSSLMVQRMNNRIEADSVSGIAKLIKKYAVTDLDEVGYGCTYLKICFDSSLAERDQKVFDDIREYLTNLESEEAIEYSYCRSVDEDGWECMGDPIEEVIEQYIDTLIECGFTGTDEENIINVFDYERKNPLVEELVSKQLTFHAIKGTYKGEFVAAKKQRMAEAAAKEPWPFR